jgi:tRNA(Ile)-lysidine synthase
MPGASVRARNVPPDLPALIAAARGRAVGADERMAVATSGGPDSLALLSLAAAAFPGQVTALTVDHRLRPESAAEAASVAAQCAARGIAQHTLVRSGEDFTTAHHADDQAETLLMRLNRASGSDGLAGIRATRLLRPGVTLVRPLLGCRKADLIAVATAAGWLAVDDPGNRDPRHDRTAMRSLLAAHPALNPVALAASAAHLATEAEALAWAADLAWQGRVREADGALLVDAAGLPAALVQRLLARAVETLAGRPARGGDIARLAARLGAGQAGTVAGIAARPGTMWRLCVTPPPQQGGKRPQKPA